MNEVWQFGGYANQLPKQVEAAIVSAKRKKAQVGARSIRKRLLRRLPHAVKTPETSTIHEHSFDGITPSPKRGRSVTDMSSYGLGYFDLETSAGSAGKFLRPKSVTYVSGTDTG